MEAKHERQGRKPENIKARKQTVATDLRRRADQGLKKSGKIPPSSVDIRKLVHELQVHQIELEMQNEELRLLRSKAEMGLESYTVLYDFAPVGYFTLDRDGMIRQANLTGARLFRVKRAQLVKSCFRRFISEADQPAFHTFLTKVFQSPSKQIFDAALLREETGPLWVCIEAEASEDRQECRVAVMDITDRKKREEEFHRLNRILKVNSLSSQAMMRATDELEYMNEVCRIVVEDCGYGLVWIGFVENDGAKSIRPVAYAGFEEGYLKTMKIRWANTERGCGPTGTAIRTGKPSLCQNILTDPQFAPWREEARKRGYASAIALPLTADGKTFGSMSIYSRKSDSFSEEEVKLLSELGDDLAYGITAIRLSVAHAKVAAEAEEAKSLLDALMKYIPEGITIANAPDLRIRMVSRYGQDLLAGQHDGMAVGQVADQWKVYRSDGTTPVAHENLPLTRAIRHGEIIKNEELVQINAKGEPLNLLCNAAPLYDRFNHITGGIVAWRDITEIKQVRREIRHTWWELTRSNRDLEQFAFVASHDLKEPLRMVRGFMSLLKSRYQNTLDAKANEYISFAIDAAARMQELIDALLNYSRLGRSNENKLTDLSEVVERALINLHMEIKESDAVITQDPLPTVAVNPLELTQVFQNLIGNAIKFRRKGLAPKVHIGARRILGSRGQGTGVRGQGSGFRVQERGCRKLESSGSADVTETATTRQPEPRTLNPNTSHLTSDSCPLTPAPRPLSPDFWLFSVRDNGIGIEPEYSEKIFMIFQRLHTREEYPGSGIGLAICKKIVERHGGQIWVKSRLGHGSMFFFDIPNLGAEKRNAGSP